jgi:hypothetical protein
MRGYVMIYFRRPLGGGLALFVVKLTSTFH